ncbi:MAG: AAA family ATPase [Deltaproteobacteria bacterium]|nr:AAA family ATPase [Deltaproteobacteria bacterium]MBI4224146.1 AAA family ATPase [Deltaproteobacteria bacterium]
MYESYWGLTEKPFHNTPDPRFLYYSEQHREVLSRLTYAVQERVGAAMLTGVFGSGKTLIARTVLSELSGERFRCAYVANPRLDDVDLLRMIFYQLTAAAAPERKTDVLNALGEVLVNNVRNGKDVVVIIDETHTIDDPNVIEELRLLLNFQMENRFLLTLLLLGQPELKAKVEKNVQLEQRINIKCHLENLNAADTKNYIEHRLKVAGASRPIFTEEAVALITSHSGGIPRRINRLCDVCLLAGFGKQAKKINATIVEEEIEGLK